MLKKTNFKAPKYPRNRCVCIDVDDTLLIKGRLNEGLAEWAKEQKERGAEVVLWSAAGVDHARDVADRFNVVDNFTHIMSKPGYIVDDVGWDWIKYVKVLTDFL